MKETQLIRREVYFGDQITVSGLQLTSQAEVIEVSRGFFRLIWNRPTAILVAQGDQVQRIPIVDWTRIALFTLVGMTTLLTLIATRVAKKNGDTDLKENA